MQHVLGNKPGAALLKAPRVQTIPHKKKSKSLLLVVLLAAALIVAGAAYYHLRPASTKAETSNKNVTLTGILYAGDNSSAVIDGKIVHEGDTINGAKVIKIHKDKVELARDGETWTQQVE
jgi:type II secretory pathway component PulC